MYVGHVGVDESQVNVAACDGRGPLTLHLKDEGEGEDEGEDKSEGKGEGWIDCEGKG